MKLSIPSPDTESAGIPARIPLASWTLGFVSLLMDISSEMIHCPLPVFLVTSLGASVFIVGLIEGVAEATALIVKVFSGAFSDYGGKRKPLAVPGYGLGALSKPLFAPATSSGLVFAARLIDRVGKGIHGAPRDALVADIAPPELRGAAFVKACLTPARWASSRTGSPAVEGRHRTTLSRVCQRHSGRSLFNLARGSTASAERG